MKIKKVLLVSVFIVSTLLFMMGTKVISDMNKRIVQVPKRLEKIEKQEDDSGQVVRTETVHEESSIKSEEPVNLLVLGLDDGGQRCDVVTLFNCNPSSGKANILSIARDTKVYRNGRKLKFNALYGIGQERQVIEEINRITGLPVHYYVTIDFKGFRKIIDTLGGVVIDVPIDMHYDDPVQNLHIHLNKGLQVLDGKKAEQFVRYRKGNRKGEGYIEGDIGRIKVQQEFIKAFIEQKFKLKYLLKAEEIFRILKEHVRTNIEIDDVLYYVGIVRNLEIEAINTYSLPGEVVQEGTDWYLVFDKSATSKMIQENFYK